MLAVETGEFLRDAEDVADLVVGVHEGKPVYLREVAQVEAGAAQPAAPCLVHAGRGRQRHLALQRPAACHPGADV